MAVREQKRKNGREEEGMVGLLCHVGLGLGFSCVLAALLLLLASLLAYSCDDPDRFTTPLAYTVLYLSAMSAGFISTRRHRGDALLCGILCGALLTAVLFLLSLLLQGVLSVGPNGAVVAILRLLTVVASVIGAYLGLPRPSHKHRRRR